MTFYLDYSSFLGSLFDTSSFPPRWYCGQWTLFEGWTYITANLLIWLAYFIIPLVLLYFTKRLTEVPLRRTLWLFSAFVLLCGLTHFNDALIFWVPIYRLNALILSLTAIVSLLTVVHLLRIMPHLLSMKSPAELEQVIEMKVAELEEAYYKLASSEAQLQALINHNPDLITRVNKDLEIEFVNESLLTDSGFKKEDFVGKKHIDLGFPSELILPFVDKIKQVFQTKEPLNFYTQGEEENIHYDVAIVPLKNPQGKVEKVLTVARDISELKQTQNLLRKNVEDLEIQNKRLSVQKKHLEDFARIISHDLRAPIGNLNTLITFYDEAESQAEKDEMFASIREVNARLSQITEELLEIMFFRKASSLNEKTNIRENLEKVKSGLQKQLQEAGAIIKEDLAVENLNYPSVYLDSILQNLISNSIKYAAENKDLIIEIQTKNEGGFVLMTYRDNGQGIDLEKHGEKLFKLRQTFHQHPEARGIGLYITKNQIESFGGSIEVQSRVGEGTEFTVKFRKQLSPELLNND